MNSIDRTLVDTLSTLASERARVLVAIAGAPGAGKSTLAERLVLAVDQRLNRQVTCVVPMDGFHLDNELLDQRLSRSRKGAPHTFDADGFRVVLERLQANDNDVIIPVFDRVLDLARAGARVVSTRHRVLLIEGNYLLLDQAPWHSLSTLFDFRIFLDVPEEELRRRLVQRWLDHDHTPEQAIARAESNDLPNARLVLNHQLPADYRLTGCSAVHATNS